MTFVIIFDLAMNLQSRCYSLHFMDEETEAREGHIAREWVSWDVNTGFLFAKPFLFHLTINQVTGAILGIRTAHMTLQYLLILPGEEMLSPGGCQHRNSDSHQGF
jgi:hypothetical protein